MVYQTISETVTLQRNTSMATAPASAPLKSQPLHNFSLPFLKWGKNHTNTNRSRKLIHTSRESPGLNHRSSSSEPESDGSSQSKKVSESENQKSQIGSHSAKNLFSFSHCSSNPSKEASQKNQIVSEGKILDEETRSKLLIDLPTRNKDGSVFKNKSPVVGADEVGGEELVLKPWNLRPRRAVIKNSNEIRGEIQENLSCMPQNFENLPKSLRLRNFAEALNTEEEKKRKFSISLSREEIEEDFFVLTGSKLPRRPKKRAKNIQRQLDNIFPGLWLAEITADSYRIPDVPSKR